MRKTLTAVLVVGAVLLVASPAQAEPVKQRAYQAVVCVGGIDYLLEKAIISGGDFSAPLVVEYAESLSRKCRRILGYGRSGRYGRELAAEVEAVLAGEPVQRAVIDVLVNSVFVPRILAGYRVTLQQALKA